MTEIKKTIEVAIATDQLAKVDALVANKTFDSRSDVIENTLDTFLNDYQEEIKTEEAVKSIMMGINVIKLKDLKNKPLTDMASAGILIIDQEVTLEDMKKVYRTIEASGKVKAAPAIKEYYGLK